MEFNHEFTANDISQRIDENQREIKKLQQIAIQHEALKIVLLKKFAETLDCLTPHTINHISTNLHQIVDNYLTENNLFIL